MGLLQGNMACKGVRVAGCFQRQALDPVRVHSHRRCIHSRLLSSRPRRLCCRSSTEEAIVQQKAEPLQSTDEAAAKQALPTDADPRAAVAAKISAARQLARKLAEEKQAAVEATRKAADASLDEGEVQEIWRSVEAASSQAAREAARADAKARAAKKKTPLDAQLVELERLKAENAALKKMVQEVTANKGQAQERLTAFRQQYSHLYEQNGNGTAPVPAAEPSNGVLEDRGEQQKAPEQSDTSTAPEPPPSKPSPPEVPIADLAKKALSSGSNIFTVPEGGIPTGGSSPKQSGEPSILFYNRQGSGALPSGGAPVLKAGVNKWEEIWELDMRKPEGLEGVEGDWWCVNFDLTEDVFHVEFVVMADRSTGAAVDNNRQQNYQLPLAGVLTEDQIHSRRAQAVAAFERENMQALEAEEDRLWQEQMQGAFKAADQARAHYKELQEADMLEHAQQAAEERRSLDLGNLQTEPSRNNVFAWLHGGPHSGRKATLAYNKASGSLRDAADVMLRVGMDGWWQQDFVEVLMRPLSRSTADAESLSENGDWWGADVDIAPEAVVVDWVLSDSNKRLWDNNRNADYHSVIRDGLDHEQLVEMLLKRARQENHSKIEEGAERAAAKVLTSTELRAAAKRRRRARQHQVVFTDPPLPRAGENVDVLYNPDLTALRGRPQACLRAGWNRWDSNAEPQLLTSVVPGGMGYHRASLQVPQDAWQLDMVFSDSLNEAAFYDTNNGLDYHVPVMGGSVQRPPLRVAHVAVEMAPVAKVGGMGDVVTALARAVQDEGHQVTVIIPKYDCLDYAEIRELHQVNDYFWGGTQIKVWQAEVEGIETILLEPTNGTVWAGCIYGRNDDAARFGFFCGAALDYLNNRLPGEQRPHIVHAHDWQSAPIAFGDLSHGMRSAFTIHNLNFGAGLIGRAMSGASVCTTVSPTYAAEISGNPAIAPHMQKFYGIRNGIDNDIWDPATDRFLPETFSADSAERGKAAAKEALRQKMNLSSADVPLVAVVTRLTHQKGIHLIKHAAWRTLERGGQFVLLGSAPDPRVQGEFNALANELGRQYPDRARLWFAYNEPLSHLIYAGSDIFLVPSMFEPCGLTQLIAMRYGSVPCVRRTGGLADTVFDVDDDEARSEAAGLATNGFIFEGTDAGALDYALNRALSFYYTEREQWSDLVERIMRQDWSWAEPALDYLDLYYKALKP
ncbi:hypothetical protein WJX73_010729 [Symbiochloris irregularis]|uniref:starch synthase n=1 Tax=Symbiochloris irregularis TaxID=706552 RepID=A0AAW1P9H0_9CHLO